MMSVGGIFLFLGRLQTNMFCCTIYYMSEWFEAIVLTYLGGVGSNELITSHLT